MARLTIALLLGLICTLPASAQVVRFDTSVGDFDVVLNPTNNPLLQGHTDNFLAYVNDLRYNCTVINRADEGFVLQMGGFETNTLAVPSVIDGFEPIETFAPITGFPAAENNFTNSRGTIAMALPGLPTGGTNQDGGTSSFFVNLDDNSTLDTDFTVFAVVPDLTTVDIIMGLDQVDLTTDPNFGANPGNLAFSDVPLQNNGNLVFIERAFVLEDTAAITAATNGALQTLFNPPAAPTITTSNASAPQAVQAQSQSSSLQVNAVPEPATALLALLGAVAISTRRRR